LAKTLFIDLDEISQKWKNLDIKCSYPYHFSRKCEDYPCVNACRYDALERVEETGINVRNDCLCVSCKSCAIACPFGVIYMEILPFLTFHCDLGGAIKYGEFKEDRAQNIYKVGEVVVKARPWKKELAGEKGEQ